MKMSILVKLDRTKASRLDGLDEGVLPITPMTVRQEFTRLQVAGADDCACADRSRKAAKRIADAVQRICSMLAGQRSGHRALHQGRRLATIYEPSERVHKFNEQGQQIKEIW